VDQTTQRREFFGKRARFVGNTTGSRALPELPGDFVPELGRFSPHAPDGDACDIGMGIAEHLQFCCKARPILEEDEVIRSLGINVLEGGTPIGAGSLVRVPFSDECAILRDWVGGSAPAFIDFGSEEDLWWILKGASNGPAYVARFPRGQFVEIHRVGATQEVRDIFEKFVNDIAALVLQYESNLALNRTGQLTGRGFQQYQPFANRRSRRL